MSEAWIILIASLAAIGGWIANLVKLFSMSWELSGELVIRLVGVPVPIIGVVAGFF